MPHCQDAEFSPDPEVIESLKAIVKDHKRWSSRVNTLCLYNNRPTATGTETTLKDIVKRDDRPEVEQVLTYRDHVNQLDRTIECLRRAVSMPENEDPKTMLALTKELNETVSMRLETMKAMDKVFSDLRKDFSVKEKIMAQMTAEAARLAQCQNQHVDKIRIAEAQLEQHEKLALIAATRPAEAEVIADTRTVYEKLAEKYGITQDEVKEKLKSELPAYVEPPATAV